MANQIRRGRRIAAIALRFAVLSVIGLPVPSVQAQTFTVLHSFTGADGANPYAGLLLGSAGDLYGTATQGAYGYGVVFELSKTGEETILHSFAWYDGAYPYGALIRDKEGNLYGTTFEGGSNLFGVVFRLDAAGNETPLHIFSFATGDAPYAGVVMDGDGNLYGTTDDGGSDPSCDCGVIFAINTAGIYNVQHSFGGGADGANPPVGLVFDLAGNLDGVTTEGGDEGYGTVFRVVDRSPKETVLYSFTGTPDGAYPDGSLLLDSEGNFYGVTGAGGQGCTNSNGCGTVYRLNKNAKETVLYRFTGAPDGQSPVGSLVFDLAGNLYGTTYNGGDASCNSTLPGCGIVFKVDPAGNETVIHTFSGTDGANPYGGLATDSQGNLYGTTINGGVYGYGVVFKISLE